MKIQYSLVFLLFLYFPFSVLQAAEPVDDLSHDETMQLGEKMYRSGILPSGEPMQALVMGDIPFDGRMFTCDDCHQRSGLGSNEGTVITWPTNGKELSSPRRRTGAFKQPTNEQERENVRRTLPKYFQVEDERPAYTDKSLARVLRVGVDSAGRQLDPIMPKFRLSNRNMAILIYYLKHLSTDLSPGVDDTTLHFATVVSDDVSESDKTDMLSTLQTHIDAHNSQTRHEKRRATSGPFFKSEKHQAYRKLELHIWELKGEEESWREQLDDYYSGQPVFALLGGITGGSWEKIHTFSEERQVPCLFPITDFPKISDSDWYTLYFSKGVHQEGESAAKYVRGQLGVEENVKILQVYRQGDRGGTVLAQSFRKTWQKMGGAGVEELVLQEGNKSEQLLPDLLKTQNPAVLLLWLNGKDMESFQDIARYVDKKMMVFSSATLLENEFSEISQPLRDHLLITYPYSLPGQEERSRFSVTRWLKARKIPLRDFDIHAKMYFLGWMLSGGIKNMRSEFYRDYFFEGFDMMIDQDYAIAVYPRLTFGPGQRYASKGCYIVKLPPGQDSDLVPVNDWVTY